MERLTSDDETRAGGIVRKVDERGELDHRRALAQLPVVADRRLPQILEC
jgi:hypothetical protein